MAKGLREKLEEACTRAGLNPDLRLKVMVRVLALAASEGWREAELGKLLCEAERMVQVEEEAKELLGVTSCDAIVPALKKRVEKLKVLKTAAGFDTPPAGPSPS